VLALEGGGKLGHARASQRNALRSEHDAFANELRNSFGRITLRSLQLKDRYVASKHAATAMGESVAANVVFNDRRGTRQGGYDTEAVSDEADGMERSFTDADDWLGGDRPCRVEPVSSKQAMI